MSPTNAHRPTKATRGFTLAELLVAMSISGVVFAGILAAYTFLGRNLTRLVNTQQLEAASRRTFYLFDQDASAATQVTTATGTQVVLVLQSGASTTTVTYTYNSSTGILTRTDASGSSVLLSNLTAFDLNYYNSAGISTTSTLSVKEIDLTFSSAFGNSASGTQSQYTAVSPRLILRNKALLQ